MSNTETGGFTVRRFTVILGLALLAVTSAQAQRGSWQSEIGVQGGYARVKPAGTGANDYIDVFGVPGTNYVFGLLSYGSLYAILPWRDKIAVEPSFVATQAQSGVNGLSTARVGLRLDYALTPKIYAAAGGVLVYLEQGGTHQTALGVQAALGYRMRLTDRLNGRVEASVAFTKNTDQISAFDDYALLFGVSSRLGGAAPARRAATNQAWSPMIGLQGGYTRTHFVGAGGSDLTAISVPGFGSSLTSIGTASMVPPTLFAVFPMGRKAAIEPGLNIDRIQSGGATGFSANLSARVDYAVSGNWYAAAGGNLNYIKATTGTYGKESGTVVGLNLAWGLRYHVSGDLGGRVELNYTMYGKNKDLPVPPQNITSVLVGLTMPLK